MCKIRCNFCTVLSIFNIKDICEKALCFDGTSLIISHTVE